MAGTTNKNSFFSALAKVFSRPSMRPVTRLITGVHVLLYRLTGGKAQVATYPTCLLTTRGRKTGKLRTIPLIYIKDGVRFVIAAAYAGSDQHPTWWLNLRHSGAAVVEVMRTKVCVRADVALAQERADLWRRLVAMYPSFTDYQERTTREIPVIILTPVGSPEG